MVETRSWRQRTQSLETFQINYWLFRRCEWDKNVSGWLMILWTPRGLNGTQVQGVICNFNSKLINVEHVCIFVHFFMHLCWCTKKKKTSCKLPNWHQSSSVEEPIDLNYGSEAMSDFIYKRFWTLEPQIKILSLCSCGSKYGWVPKHHYNCSIKQNPPILSSVKKKSSIFVLPNTIQESES